MTNGWFKIIRERVSIIVFGNSFMQDEEAEND